MHPSPHRVAGQTRPERDPAPAVGWWRAPSLLVVVLVLALSALPLSAQHFPSDGEIQSMLDARVEAGGAVGIALGLLEPDGSVRTFSSGSAGAGRPTLGPTTLFEIGSISKVFTGTLLADMARRGEVDIEDPVQTYLPDGVTMPVRAGREIRLVDLATHRSALPRLPGNMAPADPSNPYADYTTEMMYAFLSGYELPRDIGAEAEYSNLGVGLLGHVLALRLGMTWEEAVRERILDPLGMDGTGVRLTPEMEARMAAGHDPAAEPVPLWDVGVLAGAGALRSDVEDMLRFLEANVGAPSTELERAMRDAHQPREPMGGSAEIGLNWITRTTDGRRIVWHNGGTAGFRTFAGFDPDSEAAVVVLTNSGIGADDLGFHLLDPEIPLAPPQLPGYAGREAVEVDPAILERYVGDYQLRPGLVATFEVVDGQFRTQLTGQPSLPLYAASETVFFLRAVEAEIEFDVDESGTVTGMTLRQGGQTIPAPKIR